MEDTGGSEVAVADRRWFGEPDVFVCINDK